MQVVVPAEVWILSHTTGRAHGVGSDVTPELPSIGSAPQPPTCLDDLIGQVEAETAFAHVRRLTGLSISRGSRMGFAAVR
jgi:hypothetical protein